MLGSKIGRCLSLLVLVAAQLGCRPARPPQGVAAPGPGLDLTRAYQGQARILPGLAEKSKISHARGDALAKGACDVAVLVNTAAFTNGTARFTLEPIGIPQLERQPANRKCGRPSRQYTLVVTGLDPRGTLASLSAEIDRLLQTPELFLASRNVAFTGKPAKSLGPVADPSLGATPDERMLARAITRPPQRLLSVAPLKRDARKGVRYAGEVSFRAIVGLDGRLYDARVPPAFDAQMDRILKALELWRYEPARRGDQPTSFRLLEERTVFSVN